MIPIYPCLMGSGSLAVAWAMDAVPIPASFVKIPRDTPVRKVTRNDPITPPVTAFGENAP